MESNTNNVPLVNLREKPMRHIILTAIDWISVKLMGISVLLYVSPGEITGWLSAGAFATTIIYNLVKISKEVSRKKHQ